MALERFLGDYQLADKQHKLYFATILEVPGSLQHFLFSACVQHIFLSFVSLNSVLSGWPLLFPLWKALFFLIFLVIPSSSLKPQLNYSWDIVPGPSNLHFAAAVHSTDPRVDIGCALLQSLRKLTGTVFCLFLYSQFLVQHVGHRRCSGC